MRGCWQPSASLFQHGGGGGSALSGLKHVPLIFAADALPPGGLHQGDHMSTYYWDLPVRQSYSRRLLIENRFQSFCRHIVNEGSLPVGELTTLSTLGDVETAGPGFGTCRTGKSIVVSSQMCGSTD